MARHALLIGVSEFADRRLNRLNAPTNDVIALRRILQDSARGGFDSVDMSVNEDFLAVRDRLAKLYHDRAPDDLLLLYYSGHGILDRGRLFLATAGSSLDAPRARSLAANDVRDFMQDSRAERQIVVLDCCHSGAFAEGAKAAGPAPAVTPDTFVGGDAGTYVLTASDSMQLAWDGDTLRSGDGNGTSRFTAWLVDGLERGEAAPDDDQISMDALYRYLFRRARSEGAPSTPQRFLHGGVGDPVISRNPLAGNAQVAPAVKEALASADYRLRLGAVTELAQQLRGPDKVQARGVRRVLEQHREHERDFAVRTAIDEVLDAAQRAAEPPSAQPAPEPAPASRPEAKPQPPKPGDFWDVNGPVWSGSQPNPQPQPQPQRAAELPPRAQAPAGHDWIDPRFNPLPPAPSVSPGSSAATLSLADRWRQVPWWARVTFVVFSPIGGAWLVGSGSDPMPRWVKPVVIGFWVLVLIAGIADGLSRP